MSDESEMVTLYFPDIESGSVSVGYCNAEIVNHLSIIPASEAAFIRHWMDNGQAVRSEDVNPFAEPTPTIPTAPQVAHGARAVRVSRRTTDDEPPDPAAEGVG